MCVRVEEDEEEEEEEEEGAAGGERRRRETTPFDPSFTSWVGKKGEREIIV